MLDPVTWCYSLSFTFRRYLVDCIFGGLILLEANVSHWSHLAQLRNAG